MASMLESVSSGQMTLEDYLEFLYGTEQGYVYSPTKEYTGEKEPPTWSTSFFSWPSQKAEIIQHIIEEAPQKEVYLAPSLFRVNDANKSAVIGSHVVWIELDGNIPESLGEIPEPSLRIKTSDNGHEHWYWRLESFNSDADWIESINRALSYKLNADTSGWDRNQVLRPPTTYNHKRKRRVEVSSFNTFIFEPSKFDTVPKPPTAAQIYTKADLLNVQEIVAKYPWPLAAFRLLRSKDVAEGDRSTKLMQLGYYCAEIGLNDREIFSCLHTADNWWGKFKHRNDREQRLNDIIVRARVKHPFANNSMVIRELPVLGLKEVLDSNVQLEWVAEGMLQSQGCGMVTAKPGVGKTKISLQFAISLALGVPFLRYNIEKPKKVAFFSLEMSLPGIKFFLSKMVPKMTKEQITLLQEHLKIIPLGQAMEVQGAHNSQLIRSVIEEHELDGIFIDSLGRTNHKDLSKDENVRPLMDWDATLRNQYKIFTWYIHHNRKESVGNKKPKTIDDVFGSGYITASIDDGYTLWSNDPLHKVVEFINIKHRYSRLENPYLVEFTDGFNLAEQTDLKALTRKQPDVINESGLITDAAIENDDDIGGFSPEGGIDF